MRNRHRFISTVVAVAALIAMPIAADAQGPTLKVGFGWSPAPNSGGAYPGELSAHNGATLGIGMNTGGVLGLGFEGMYSERGFNSSVAGSSRRLTYVDVPVYLRLAAPSEVMTPFAYVGPQGSFELRCDGRGGECPSGREKTTWAGVAGAGLKFGRSSGLTVEGRYVYGLTDLHLSTVTTTENYRNRSFMLLAGFGF